MLFDSNLSRRPFLGQVVDLDLVLCNLFLCHLSNQRPMAGRKMERSDGCGFGLQQLLANSIENFISYEKKSDSSRPEIYKALNLFDSQTESVSQEWSAATAADSETPSVSASRDASPTRPSCAGRCPKSSLSSAVDFAVKNFDCLLEQPSERLPDDWAGAQIWSQTWTLRPDQLFVMVLLPPKSQHKLCRVWILLVRWIRRNWGQLWIYINPYPQDWRSSPYWLAITLCTTTLNTKPDRNLELRANVEYVKVLCGGQHLA